MKKLVCVFFAIAIVQVVPMAVKAQMISCTFINYLFRNGQDARSTKLNFTVERASFPFLTMVQDVSQQIIDPIERVVSAGLMKKDASGNFNAEGIVTRADLAVILVKTFGLERRKTAQKPEMELSDVPKSYWAYSAIQTALKTGTMSGYRDGMFFPNQRVTRAEALAIFAQAYGVFQFPDASISEILAKYPDAGEIPNWARKSMATALYEGFVNVELGTNKINPLKPMNRGDIAYALSKYLERQVRPTSLPVRDDRPPNRGMGR
ncbi:S-layer homology domain-containing protein [Microcoleus sp. F4-D5]|uniref:S-layer homology domain-containing protein n=1 Tax=Microcoleus sp. F4-D5 TaxID=2818760 RepID=UPI002FD17929